MIHTAVRKKIAEAQLIKYPRTPHIEGSRLQLGDEDLYQIPFAELAGKELVVEEKCDGANTAISFDSNGSLLMQSRGHYLTGGGRERHYDLLKQWATVHRDVFYKVLGHRYIMYGEWLYAKHTVFYDNLPHYFIEFDIFDRETNTFLDTPTRHAMIAKLPVVSAPVLAVRAFSSHKDLMELLTQSKFIKDGHIERLRSYCDKNKEDTNTRVGETDLSVLMEGLYIKIEHSGKVVERMKFVRASFLQRVAESNSHWLSRPIIPNLLAYPLEWIFDTRLPEEAKMHKSYRY